ncbi:hypothetical protein LTR56_026251 [Elasticomyces elasticus]|nr:hypothetical protein LTR56_026251 [Elasticomyces elasticus]KAK3619051.1 hypothetical protein LTR22_026128 [Elasticomyces elasticus]KAK5729702.1 hypothetical protein LTS12_027309 [Elasticomyces elasticus]
MTHPKGWIKLSGLADEANCRAAADDYLKSGHKATPKCAEVMQLILRDHESNIAKKVDLLKPGANPKPVAQGVCRILPNLTPASFSRVVLYVALTKLDKSNGMFSFLKPPEDVSKPHTEWEEEEVVVEPGDGLLWRGDCVRKSYGGHGGIMLIFQYDRVDTT